MSSEDDRQGSRPDPAPDDTGALLRSWHGGDSTAMARLLERQLPWIRAHVHGRLGGLARRWSDTGDIVQELAKRILERGPRFVVDREVPFRRLLAHMIGNLLRNEARFHNRARRTPSHEVLAGGDTILDLATNHRVATASRPDQAAAEAEERSWIALALELLDDRSRVVVRMREWDLAQFDVIGAELDISPDAARMRYQRALRQLAHFVALLRAGDVELALDESERSPAGDVRDR